MKDIFRKFNNKLNKDPNFQKKIMILSFLISIISLILLYMLTQNNLEYKNKKLILKEPTKITQYSTFEKLVNDKKIDTVYYKEQKGVLLFTTVDETVVKQIEYNHNSKKDLYTDELKNEKYRKNPEKYKDKCIFVYKTFNPKNENFRDFLLKNNIQIVDISEQSIDVLSVASILLYCFFIIVMIRTMNVGKSDENEEVTGVPNVKFEDIEGNEEAKEEMKVIVDFLENPKKYEDMGAKIPKGVILYGPPGTGKTLLAKAIAGEAKVPFFNKSASDFVEIYVGVGAKRVKNLFKKARKKAPCIIFIDEIDAIGGQRGASRNDEKDQTLNKLLVELDGFHPSDRIIVIAATNRVDMLDNALTRSGRFDKHIPIELPNKKDRTGILKVHFKNKKLDPNINIEDIAEITTGFSGADIATLANESAIIASVKNHENITLEDIDEAYIKTAMKSNPKKDLSRNAKETETIAYHEAGHALVAKLFGNDVHKVTIIGTTSGAGGFTATTNEQEGLFSKEDFEREIKIMLGGRAAEFLLFNRNEEKITMGAVNDIERSSQVINSMIRKFGMLIKSDVEVDGEKLSMYAPFKVDDEIKNEEIYELGKKISTELYFETIKILEDNIGLLHTIAKELISKETLSREEIDSIFDNK